MSKRETWHSLCVECGPNVGVDEDGLCAYCGVTAMGAWLDKHKGTHGALVAALKLFLNRSDPNEWPLKTWADTIKTAKRALRKAGAL